MKIEIQSKVKGTYDLQLIGPQGELKQHVVCHNTIAAYFTRQLQAGTSLSLSKIHFGNGSGTPAMTDTALFALLWERVPTSVSYTTLTSTSAKVDIYGNLPASADYVGTITEIGYKGYIGLCTHSMLTDSEGNPISITKTSLDNLLIKITIQMEVTFPSYVTVLDLRELSSNGATRPSRFDNFARSCVEQLIAGQSKLDTIGFIPTNAPLPYVNLPFDIANLSVPLADVGVQELSLTDTLRVTTSQDNNGYRRYLAIVPYSNVFAGVARPSSNMFVDLKNSDIFPPYTMADIPIGTGDGVTFEFKCPLGHFVTNSDKVYKNGVLLVRDVDYTIDPENNQDGVPALSPSANLGVNITGESGTPSGFLIPQLRSSGYYSSHYDITYCVIEPSRNCVCFSYTHPLKIDWGVAQPCNTLHLVGTKFSSSQVTGTQLTIYYSTDNVTYTQVAQTNITTAAQDITWNEVSARYWKIVPTYDNPMSFLSGSMLGHIGQGIRFTTPPADGDILTMEVLLDIPYKNAQHVIDITPTMTISFSS